VILAIAVGLAGGIGSVLRYLVDGAIQDRVSGAFPCGTLTINVAGSLVLGILTGLLWYHGVTDRWHDVVGVGFCGGLTTWSTASWETVRLVDGRLYRLAFVYTLGGLALAIAAAIAGIALVALV
jgi:fluoride exporter